MSSLVRQIGGELPNTARDPGYGTADALNVNVIGWLRDEGRDRDEVDIEFRTRNWNIATKVSLTVEALKELQMRLTLVLRELEEARLAPDNSNLSP